MILTETEIKVLDNSRIQEANKQETIPGLTWDESKELKALAHRIVKAPTGNVTPEDMRKGKLLFKKSMDSSIKELQEAVFTLPGLTEVESNMIFKHVDDVMDGKPVSAGQKKIYVDLMKKTHSIQRRLKAKN